MFRGAVGFTARDLVEGESVETLSALGGRITVLTVAVTLGAELVHWLEVDVFSLSPIAVLCPGKAIFEVVVGTGLTQWQFLPLDFVVLDADDIAPAYPSPGALLAA